MNIKKTLSTLSFFILALHLSAQTNAPVWLALISETDETSPIADVLTAKLSGDQNIQLLERDQIDRVYREQGLSAANTDYLKLGRVLGADGLLILDVVRAPQATNLVTRLIAVKPGVILADGGFSWPATDPTALSDAVAIYLDKFLPKLTLSAGEAIPLSVVNFRSPVATSEAQETERRLTLLTIQRLSEEPRLFVLERQKMALLSDEKNLKADDSMFWNGGYLLDGVMDQNGYSPDTVTLNARLTPPNGGTPVLLEANGPRNDLAGVINQLTAKIMDALKIKATIKPWNSADEAAKYFEEARWALRWGAPLEAESAADSAWALGKRDLDCATVRVNAYMGDTLSRLAGFEQGTIFISPDTDPTSDSDLKELSDTYPAVIFNRKPHQMNYDALKAIPNPKNIDSAYHALKLYYEFSRTSPDGLPKVLIRGPGGNDWHNSDWYQLGINNLVAGSKVLAEFNLVPKAQQPVADKLADLRTLARTVAAFIAASPTVHDSYFVGDRVANYDELDATMMGGSSGNHAPNIFACEVSWGCFWQETPADAIDLYRHLMASPVFCYLHDKLWFRQPSQPFVTGWDDIGRQQTPAAWSGFVQELNTSTNVLLRMEGRALKVLAAKNDEQLRTNFIGLMDEIITNRDELVLNNVDLFYLDWRARDLLEGPGQDSVTPALEQLQEDYRTNYSHMLDALQTQYQNHTAIGDTPNARHAAFEKEKQFLQASAPFNSSEAWFGFIKMFQNGFHDYSPAQALEIKPLFAFYRSNLVAQAAVAQPNGKHWPLSGVALADQTLDIVNKILNIPPASSAQTPPQPRFIAAAPPIRPAIATNTPDIITNVVTVATFLPIPLDDLARQGGLNSLDSFSATISTHLWQEGRLLVNFDYSLINNQYGSLDGSAIAILSPATGKWTVISRPKTDFMSQTRFYYHSAILNGDLFDCDGGQIRKYDPTTSEWQSLPVSDGNNYQLFAVNGHLYAASQDTILEILAGGKSTRVLASARRQPPASILDAQSFGTPALFGGPDHLLRVSAADRLFTWTGSNWHEDGATPLASEPPTLHPAGLLYRQTLVYDQPTDVSRLLNGEPAPDLCLWQKKLPRPGVIYGSAFQPARPAGTAPQSLWQMPDKNFFAVLPATLTRSNLFLLAMHPPGQDATVENGCDAELFCFSEGFPRPQKVLLKFAAAGGSPVTGPDSTVPPDFMSAPPAWIMAADDQLFFGLEKFGLMGPQNNAWQSGPGHQPGVWMLPLHRLDSAIAAQQSTQLAQQSAETAAAVQAKKNILDKYDLNHNGVIDPDEREVALDDPAFIASQLEIIDANHNGLLDLAELDYFDANHNQVLDPKELAGINLALHLLAQKDLLKFDTGGNGYLNQDEFENALESGLANSNVLRRGDPTSVFFSTDANRDRKVDASELESYLRQTLRRSLHPQGRGPMPLPTPNLQDPSQPVDINQLFKGDVENYWRNPGSVTNLPPFLHRPPVAFPSTGPAPASAR